MPKQAPPSSEVLTIDILDNTIAVVTMNRPAQRNAVNVAMARALATAVAWTETTPEIRVAILASSHDGVFSAGADLADLAAGRGPQLVDENGFAGFSHFPRTKPWIAAVRGAALAGGFELALACDMIVSSTDGRFGLPEARRGLIAGAGGVYRLARAIPRHIAIEMIVTGEPIEADRAKAFGLVNCVAESDQVLSAATAMARKIAGNGPLAVRQGLAVAGLTFDLSESELRRHTDQATAMIMASQDAKEGARSFLEKRAPVWSGR